MAQNPTLEKKNSINQSRVFGISLLFQFLSFFIETPDSYKTGKSVDAP